MPDLIRAWFEAHDEDDSDFYVSQGGFHSLPPRESDSVVIYTTKPHCLFRLAEQVDEDRRWEIVGNPGLPVDWQMDWLRAQLGSRRVLFLGDADPVDLLLFAWLREHLGVEYLGLSDDLLDRCGVELQDHLTIAMSAEERAALPLLASHLGDLSELLGPKIAGLLTNGCKMEVEALFSFARRTPSEISKAIA